MAQQTDETNQIVPVDQLFPEELFIVPVRYRPVFPGMVTPLMLAAGEMARAMEVIKDSTSFIGLVLQKDDDERGLDPENLYQTGTIVRILKKLNMPDEGVNLLINTLQRFQIKEFVYTRPHLVARVTYYKDEVKKDRELTALTRSVLSRSREMMNENPMFGEEVKVTLVNVDEPGRLADFVTNLLSLEKEEYQSVLETFDVKERLARTLVFLDREFEMLQLQKKIHGRIQERFESQQREMWLRRQLEEIRRELGGDKARDKDSDYYRSRFAALELTSEAAEKADDEIQKLDVVDTGSHEYSVIRNYLDTLLDLPWESPEYQDISLEKARRILNKDHFGLDDVKDRIIEHLAVRQLRREEKGSIICLVGPPGVGKTSLGRSIARAMNKKFYRFSLGGMRDEAEIKGHRRTYVGAMPGKVITALRTQKARDLVLMLDEIDKLSVSYQGDPASALLEVLDPEQNREFRDHYLDLPFDLSRITFITTANTLDSIPGPLLDRMEVIRLSGYVLEEKLHIARKYIIPRAIRDNGLSVKNAPVIEAGALRDLIDGYSREAGVRSLDKTIHKLYRKAAAATAEGRNFQRSVGPDDLEEILGGRRFRNSEDLIASRPGSAIGLAWTAMGGATLPVETLSIPGRGRLKITGQLGKVMNESVEIAFSYVQKRTDDIKFWNRFNFHIHVPDGATPKDGPSAGITVTTALLSLYLGKAPRKGYAMTGEIRLTGDVLPIGGLKEKTIAAKRAGIRHVIFPADNETDWKELPASVRKGVTPHPVSHYDQVYKLLF